jgi:hypothetical protein
VTNDGMALCTGSWDQFLKVLLLSFFFFFFFFSLLFVFCSTTFLFILFHPLPTPFVFDLSLSIFENSPRFFIHLFFLL